MNPHRKREYFILLQVSAIDNMEIKNENFFEQGMLSTNLHPPSFPQLCGLIGKNPTRLSQAMHSAGFSYLKLAFVYVAFDTIDTTQALMAIRSLGFRGLSLTIPHKEQAISLVDALSAEAKAIGAVNTVVNIGGELKGYNTDCFGIAEALREANVNVRQQEVFILGAGGAARAAVYTVKNLGASRVVVSSRDSNRAELLARNFSVEHYSYDALAALPLASFGILINATPLGSALSEDNKNTPYPFDITALPEHLCVFDFVTRTTPLIQVAQTRGSTVIEGLRMLLYQAVQQFLLFTGKEAPREVMEQALLEEVKRSSV